MERQLTTVGSTSVSAQTFYQNLPNVIRASWDTAGSVVSVEEVVSLVDEPKIAKLSKISEESTYKAVGRILTQMAYNMHLDNGLTSDNLRHLAKRLTTDQELKWWLTLPDIGLLCRRIQEGYYGNFYGHFSPVEFNECLVKYCKERTDIHRRENDKTVTDVDSVTVKDVGYKVGEDGRLIPVSPSKPLPPPLYWYDDYGKRVSKNHAAWKKKPKPMSAEEAAKVERDIAIVTEFKRIVRENHDIDEREAFIQAEKIVDEKQ